MMELKIPPPIVALITALLMWLSKDYLSFISLELQSKQWLCGSLVAIGLLIDFCALWLFIRAKTSVNPIQPNKASSLVTNGIYSYTRNPMYLGNFMFLNAWLVWLASPLSAFFLVCYVLYMNRFQIAVEERMLSEKFGNEYASYCQNVRRWI